VLWNDHAHLQFVRRPPLSPWKACPRGFFLPVKVLSRVFRGKLLALLRQANDAGELLWRDGLSHLEAPGGFDRFLRPQYEREWCVYAQPPAAGAEQVLKYLARYTHRVAIGNSRIDSLHDDGRVTFTYKDYGDGSRIQRMTLAGEEFLRRFLQHVLPRGFVRLRGFGLLANGCRQVALARCRAALGVDSGVEHSLAAERDAGESAEEWDEARIRCPFCGEARLRLSGTLPRPTVSELVARTYAPHSTSLLDSS
jgi:hypothetical protein